LDFLKLFFWIFLEDFELFFWGGGNFLLSIQPTVQSSITPLLANFHHRSFLVFFNDLLATAAALFVYIVYVCSNIGNHTAARFSNTTSCSIYEEAFRDPSAQNHLQATTMIVHSPLLAELGPPRKEIDKNI
jgi:hypothetical protein